MPDNKKDVELHSAEVREILTAIPSTLVRYGNILIGLIILSMLVLSWFIKYPDTIDSKVTLTTEVPPQHEYSKVDGKIQHFFVKDSQFVHKKDILVVFESTADYKDILKLEYYLNDVDNSYDELELSFEELDDLKLGNIQENFSKLKLNLLDYKLSNLYNPDLVEYRSIRQSQKELVKRLETLRSQQEIEKQELKIKERDLQRNEDLYEKGIISEKRYEEVKYEFLNKKRTYRNTELSIFQVNEAIELSTKNSKISKYDEIRKRETSKSNLLSSIKAVKKSIEEWKFKYLITSSIEGEVALRDFRKKNQTVNKGDYVLSILPKHRSDVIAKIESPMRKAGEIKIGQKVLIHLENYPHREYGSIKGTVSDISEVPTEDALYIIYARVPNTTTSYGENIEIRYGMRGEANIVIEERRLIEKVFFQFKSLLAISER